MGIDRIRTATRSWAAEMVPQAGLARRLAVLAVVQAFGFGVFLTSGAIFFTQTIGLSTTEVGVGLSVANVFGLLFAVPIGRLADRYGARHLLLITYAALAVLFACYSLVGGFLGFVVLTSLISIGETSSNPLRMTLTRASFQADEQVRVGAQMRSLFNVGFMVGAMIAGAALTVGNRPAFYGVIAFTAAAQALCAVITWRLGSPPHARARHEGGAKPRSGLRDVRFVGLALLCGVLELYQPILVVGLPLWIITSTGAPAGVNAVLLVLDTAMVFVLQVALSRGAETPGGSARILLRSGVLLAACCAVFALSQDADALIAVPLLLVGTVALVLGEISQAAGAFGLSLHLPPPGRQGEYQGVFALGRGLQQTAGPFVVTSLVIGLGAPGWGVLAVVFLAAGLLCVPLTHSAERVVQGRAPQLSPDAA
ncbi:MAG: MFS transporter [Umezawaea sp.]